MEGQVKVTRVLIANRGEIARRLIRHYAEQGVETCVVFSEADAEQPYLDDADYAVYLNGRTVAETYMDAGRVVSAAMDAGCDAIHPGTCFLAEHLDLYDLAHRSNIAVIGADPRALPLVVDRAKLRGVARKLNLPVIPSSEVLSVDDDGMEAAARIGAPLYVKAVQGGGLWRVDDLSALPDALAAVREMARLSSGDPAVYLERAVEARRQVGTVIVADRQNTCVHLGETDGSLEFASARGSSGESHYCTWVEEAGNGVAPELREQLGQAAVALARAVRWVGVGKVRWALTPHGGFYLLGFSARLTTGYDLVEEVHGVDLLQAQFTALAGEPLGWEQADVAPAVHGLQLRIFHIDPRTRTRPEGVLERLVLPDGVRAEVGVEERSICTADTEPLVVKLNITAPTRHAAVVRAKAALEELIVEGIPTNAAVLRDLVGRKLFWDGDYGVGTLAALVDEAG